MSKVTVMWGKCRSCKKTAVIWLEYDGVWRCLYCLKGPKNDSARKS